MPPRSGKSEMTSKFFPAWYLGTYPDNKVMFISYESTFATQFGGWARDLMDEYGKELFDIELKADKQAASNWGLKGHNGVMYSIGAGGAVVGKGGNLIIIDDPLKNDEEANSVLIREKLWNWYGTTLYTRQQPGASIVLISTRWHEDDLTGKLLKEEEKGGEKWEHICLPAIATEDEKPYPLGMGRKPGEALWPEMWPLDKLNQMKTSGSMSSYMWASLYQQSPIPEGGGLFKTDWVNNFYERTNDWLVMKSTHGYGYCTVKDCWVFTTVDMANKVTDLSDNTVIATWMVTPNKDLLLINLYRDRLNYDEVYRCILKVYQDLKPSYIGIENTGVAIQMINELRNKGLPIRQLEPQGKGKQNRANAPMGSVIRMEMLKVFFDEKAPYLKDIQAELLSFPKGRRDDFVDALSYACNELTKLDTSDQDDFAPYSLSGREEGRRLMTFPERSQFLGQL